MSALTARTEESRALSDDDASNRRAAALARHSFAVVDVELELEVAGRTLGVHVIAERRSSALDGEPKHVAETLDEKGQTVAGNSPGRAPGA